MLNINDTVFFGRLLENFQDLLLKQATAVFDLAGIIVPVRSCSLLLAIKGNEGVSASDLSRALGYSHQLVLQKIPKLKDLDLIRASRDPNDERRRVFQLTKKGIQQVQKLEEVLPSFSKAYEDLFGEVGNVEHVLSSATSALQTTPLIERIDLPEHRGMKRTA